MRTQDTFRTIRIGSDLDEAFVSACRAAGLGTSEALRGLMAAWVRDVAESRSDEGAGPGRPVESPAAGERSGAGV